MAVAAEGLVAAALVEVHRQAAAVADAPEVRALVRRYMAAGRFMAPGGRSMVPAAGANRTTVTVTATTDIPTRMGGMALPTSTPDGDGRTRTAGTRTTTRTAVARTTRAGRFGSR